MDPWSIGLVVLIAAGLVATVAGALYDRARHRRRTAELLAPPERVIPQFSPDAPAPRYLTELQARRRPEDLPSTALEPTDRDSLTRELRLGHAVRVHAGYASRDFVTDPAAGLAVLDTPAVLVCGDPVESIRELLGLLERCSQDRRPLVIVAPEIAPEALATLEVNTIQGLLSLLVVKVPDGPDQQTVTATTGATRTERRDRQAGYLPPDHLGRCVRWVSTATDSHLVTSPS